MLTQAPRTASWAGTGAKAATRAIVSDPTSAVPTNLKFRSTERLPGGPFVMRGTLRNRAPGKQARTRQGADARARHNGQNRNTLGLGRGQQPSSLRLHGVIGPIARTWGITCTGSSRSVPK